MAYYKFSIQHYPFYYTSTDPCQVFCCTKERSCNLLQPFSCKKITNNKQYSDIKQTEWRTSSCFRIDGMDIVVFLTIIVARLYYYSTIWISIIRTTEQNKHQAVTVLQRCFITCTYPFKRCDEIQIISLRSNCKLLSVSLFKTRKIFLNWTQSVLQKYYEW